MSVSALFGATLALSPAAAAFSSSGREVRSLRARTGCGVSVGVTTTMPVIECSSRPQKKATAHHKKTRPRKTQAWDIRRGPAVYAPLPPLPPDYAVAVAYVEPVESVPEAEVVEA